MVECIIRTVIGFNNSFSLHTILFLIGGVVSMINITSTNQNVLIEWYDGDGMYRRVLKKPEFIYPSSKINRRRKPLKEVTDIYTKKKYMVYVGKGTDAPRLTIPYRVKRDYFGNKMYDPIMGAKLLYFQKIIDKGVSLPHSVTYDIETTSLDPSEGIITSIAWIDNQDGSEHTSLNEGSEKECIEKFTKYLSKHKILSLIGFNSREFDNRYLQYRCKQHGIFANINKSSNIDVMKGANKLFITGSLASMGKQLQIEEEKLDLGSDNPISLYEEGRYEELLYYNLQDVRATNGILEKLNIIEFYKALWDISWNDFDTMQYNSVFNNCLANKYLWEHDLMVSKVNDDSLGRFGGGFNYLINSD